MYISIFELKSSCSYRTFQGSWKMTMLILYTVPTKFTVNVFLFMRNCTQVQTSVPDSVAPFLTYYVAANVQAQYYNQQFRAVEYIETKHGMKHPWNERNEVCTSVTGLQQQPRILLTIYLFVKLNLVLWSICQPSDWMRCALSFEMIDFSQMRPLIMFCRICYSSCIPSNVILQYKLLMLHATKLRWV